MEVFQPDKDFKKWMMQEEGDPILNGPKNVKGDATIGWGQLLHRGRVTAAYIKKHKGYTEADAKKDFEKDLEEKGVGLFSEM
jgi:hypothetical protein